MVTEKINILHLSGLNGLFRKRTDVLIKILNEIYIDGFIDFNLNVVIQGNFDNKNKELFNKPFITLKQEHLSYSNILNMYNENHISIQISKHEGLGLGFFESCYMNTPVITLNAPPHNEIIHHNKNGWLLSCDIKIDDKPENPYTIIEQTQINESVIKEEIKTILKNKSNINEVIRSTKIYTESIYSENEFKKNINNILKN
tara:strand:- start:98 stop:700 length:603 start_codon:yes stop_codon:yes gene_type:complete